MQSISISNPPPAVSSPTEKHFAQGQRIHDAAGTAGEAWRVVAGVVRLDTVDEAEPMFGGMALPGDVVGAEVLLFGRFTFRATALTPCVLAPWPGGATAENPSLLPVLAQTERRAARIVALRAGQAIERVRRLIGLLAPAEAGAGPAVLPRLRDMADITALTVETVSRALSDLRQQGVFQPAGQRRGCGTKTYRPVAPALAAGGLTLLV